MLDEKSREIERLVYPWSEPFTPGDPLTSCAAIPPETWSDGNADGRWDTWRIRLGPDKDGECSIEYRIDTKLTGEPDWIFTKGFLESQDNHESIHASIVARRGF